MTTIDYHRQNPEVSLEQHMRQKHLSLGSEMASLRRIYLDLRFWILFREASLGRNQDIALIDLLKLLRQLVSSGRYICPISQAVFIELLKQNDNETRLATAELIDELSLGVTLIPHESRVRQELCNSFYEQAGASGLIPIHELVWTKLSYIFGQTHPTNTPFPPEEELVIQKSFSDHFWEISLAEMIKIGPLEMPEANWDDIAEKLNTMNRESFPLLRSYTQTFRAEFEGGLSLFRKDMVSLLSELDQRGYKAFGEEISRTSQNKRFEYFSSSLPTLHIGSSCHAAVRWDQKRNLTGNDLFDFHHAEAALGYCNAFFTEKPLTTMLSQNHLGLKKYNCQIFWSPRTALDWLQEAASQ